jgi:hypothetical protein
LEVSIDSYATKKGINFTSNTTLASKISQVTTKLEAENTATKEQLKAIRDVSSRTNGILSTNHFSEYVHDLHLQPIPTDLINTWDNIQEFFEILWAEIERKKTK